MILPKRNPLAPASLATGGAKGAEAKAQGPCEGEHSVHATNAHGRPGSLPDSLGGAPALLPPYKKGRCTTAPSLNNGRCQCSACGRLLSGVREFDRHRTGPFAKPGEWQGARRCLAPAKLIARGWRTDARGFWMQGRPQRAPAGVGAPRAVPPATALAGVAR